MNDWFQDIYDKNKKTFFELLKEAEKHNTTLRLSVCPDGTVIFSSTDDVMTKTLTQDQTSITYTQFHEFD